MPSKINHMMCDELFLISSSFIAEILTVHGQFQYIDRKKTKQNSPHHTRSSITLYQNKEIKTRERIASTVSSNNNNDNSSNSKLLYSIAVYFFLSVVHYLVYDHEYGKIC